MTGTATPPVFGIGARQVRLEDAELLTGRARYTADIPVEGLTHAAFVRSPFAHARIESIDVSEAEAVDGVVAVLTHATLDLPKVYMPQFEQLFASNAFHRRPLATDNVRFVGDIVAVVIAETPAIAADASELVLVDYDPLPAVVDAAEAVGDGATLLFPEAGSNVAVEIPFEAGERPAPVDGDAGEVTIRQTIGNHRMAVAPMEGAAITAVPDPESGRMTAYVSTQMPHAMRDLSASLLGIEPSDLRLVTPAVGGGFGGKTPADADYVIVLAAARNVARPVRWVQSRAENIMTMQARDHRFDVILRATPEGKVTSVEVDALTDVGAYPGIGCAMTMTTRSLATGAYDIPHLRFDLRCVATNTAPTGAFRGAGRPEAIAMLERAVDILAAELGIDPVEVRRRNLIRPGQFPYATLTGLEYDTGDYERCLDEALRLADYEGLRKEQKARREHADRRYLGIGVSFYVEVSAGSLGYHQEYASVEVGTDGRARIQAGTSVHGQGHHTAYAQILTSVLGIPLEHVDFVDGDTDVVPRGMGTGGSRSIQVAGTAVKLASEQVLDKARALAGHLLEADAADIVVADAGLGVQGVPASTLSWAELAEVASDTTRLPEGMEPGLFAEPGFVQDQFGTAPFGAHVAVVEVDADTGRVELVRLVAVDDCGTVINPLMAEGQVHGGLLGGIGQALFEEIRYDADGNPLTTSFADYGMPSAAELPSFETSHTVTPTSRNPLGAKGLGEAGTTGSLGAVHNAVVDAVAHLGIRHIELPLTPLNVWTALQEAQGQAG
jgi:aerobic carbon-monoxide dehydrogenase large subunit